MLVLILLFSALAAPVAAQDQASTLSRLTDVSQAVAVVTVLEVTDPDSLHHRVVFATEARIAGEAPARFEISEPAGRGCGRALWGLAPGAGFVAFLTGGAQAWHLAVSSARSLAPASVELVAHVRELARTSGGAGRVGVLARALTSGSLRVRRDAALALPLRPDLEGADARARGEILAALPGLLDGGDPAAAELVIAVMRLGLEDARSVLVPAFLEDRQPGLGDLLKRAILGLGAEAAVSEVMACPRGETGARERAVQLLAEVPAPAARRALLGFLADPSPRVSVGAASALLRNGSRRLDLEALAPGEVLDRAEQQLRSAPRFRSILKGGLR